jgi:hypothetical protein
LQVECFSALPLAFSFCFAGVLGINYVPMLIYAIAIARGDNARAEIGYEINDKRRAMAKYRRLSIFLLVPLLVPVVALGQERHKARAGQLAAGPTIEHRRDAPLDGQSE